LGNIRNKLSVFKTGGYYELYSEGSTIVYERIFGDDIAVVGVNNGHNTITLDFDEEMVDLLTGKVYKNNLELKNGDIVLLVSTINYEN
jgi:beta-galactosidase GanA